MDAQLLDVDALRHQHLLVRNTVNATRLFCEASVCHPTKIAFNKMSRAPEDLTAINTKAVDYQKKFVRISNLDPMIDSIVQGSRT